MSRKYRRGLCVLIVASAVALGVVLPAAAGPASALARPVTGAQDGPPPPTLVAPSRTNGVAGPRQRPGLPPRAARPGGTTSRVGLKLERDGRLTVTEQIAAPPGRTLTRTVPLRFAAGNRTDRVFRIRDARVRGNGAVSTGTGTVTVRVTGPATVRYVVEGAVVRASDHEEVRWQAFSGWDARFDSVQASLVAPKRPQRVDCLAGAPDSDARCASSSVGASGLILAEQSGLAAGDRVNLAVRLPADTVPANAVTARTGPFDMTEATGAWLLGLTAALLAAVGLLWFVRGRDARVGAAEVGPVEPLATDESGTVYFASPDGVLPGQVGTVIDQHVDVVDVTATVVDLAVRNYLWLAEAGGDGPDWWIVRRNPPDGALSPYERAVYEAVLPGGTDSVLMSQLAGAGIDLATVRAALYADVTRQGWFSRGPGAERRRWLAVGGAVAGLGVLLTLLLAVTIGHALVGLAVVLGGAALAGVARWMPARTRAGSALVAQISGLQRYLATVTAPDVPAETQELVFSRSLPYAVVLGQMDHWLAAFESADTAADGVAGLYWFATATDGQAGQRPGGTATAEDLREFTTQFPAFTAALDGVLARAGSVRGKRSRG